MCILLGLHDFAGISEHGAHEDYPHFPFQLIFVPTHEMKHKFPQWFTVDFYEQLKEITPGTILYDIYAMDNPTSAAIKIGEMINDTPFLTSNMADQQLFFQHTTFEQDLLFRPEWKADCIDAARCKVTYFYNYHCFVFHSYRRIHLFCFCFVIAYSSRIYVYFADRYVLMIVIAFHTMIILIIINKLIIK